MSGKEFRMPKEGKTPGTKFFDGVKAEFKKIIWPDRDTLLKQSVVVVAITIVLGVIIIFFVFVIMVIY